MICKEMAKVNIDDKIAQMMQDAVAKIKNGQMEPSKRITQKENPAAKARYILRINGDQYGNFITCKRSDCSVDVSTCSECRVFRGQIDRNIYCDYNDNVLSIMKDEDDI
jgi:hypothetical protein